MNFECEDYEVIGDDSQSMGRCVVWCEARVGLQTTVQAIGALSFIAAGMLATGGLIGRSAFGAEVCRDLIIAAAITGFVAMFAWAVYDYLPTLKKWIVFRHDGTIESSEEGGWKTTVADIANIECEEARRGPKGFRYTHGVRVITKRGRVLHIAKNLEPDDAAGLAVVMSESYGAVKYVDQRRTVGQTGSPVMVW
ncbi:MAG: hypothetical protein ACKVP7_26500 [Hyphomicrobiaceae bacterium]